MYESPAEEGWRLGLLIGVIGLCWRFVTPGGSYTAYCIQFDEENGQYKEDEVTATISNIAMSALVWHDPTPATSRDNKDVGQYSIADSIILLLILYESIKHMT